jgi:hypothetical protein
MADFEIINAVKQQAEKLKGPAKEAAMDVAAHIATSKHYQNFKSGKYRKGFGVAGAVLGAYKTATDTDDDTPISAALNMGVGAGMAYGAGRGLEWLANDDKAKEVIKEGVKNFGKKEVTAADVGKAVDAEQANEVMKMKLKGKTSRTLKVNRKTAENLREVGEAFHDEQIPIQLNDRKTKVTVKDWQDVKLKVEAKTNMKKQAFLKKMKNHSGKLGVAVAIGAGVIGAAGILDASNELHHKSREGRMLAYEEENLQRKKDQKRKSNQKAGYGYVDMGQIPLDMFEQRVGHYKMGNSKFQ